MLKRVNKFILKTENLLKISQQIYLKLKSNRLRGRKGSLS